MLHYTYLLVSGRYTSVFSLRLRTLCFIVFFLLTEVVLHHILALPPDVMLHCVLPAYRSCASSYSFFASGRYASLFSFRLRTLCFISFFPHPDVMLHYVLSASGRYASFCSFRLRTLCFILFFPPPDVILHFVVPPPDVMLHFVDRLWTLCFIMFFPPPDFMLYDIVVASDVMFIMFFPPPDVML